eukprot:CAMPEP_0116871284 /NCGR_PEP_ID=MMETSP0463-20121206/1549_1 /TAXON_ID=181622 /ORGANISM="Strombidinopsis sp, Strain SopsisLIS2011" /LENGTH=52 /DNA_ID=CAMNT_0004509381 /DNA_START=155 /DNA_END=310 /DNA_ORIENTATION=+
MKYKQELDELQSKEHLSPSGQSMSQQEYDDIKLKWHVVKANIHPDTGKPVMW